MIRFSNYKVEISRVYEDQLKSKIPTTVPRYRNISPCPKTMNYKNLDIYILAMDLFLKIHPLSLKLPKYELYELGSQLRRSSDLVVSNIVEGFGRRRNREEYLSFLNFSLSSNYETLNHLFKLKKLYRHLEMELEELEAEYNLLGGKLNLYIQHVEKNWKM